MANRRHVRNDTDTLVWPPCLASVVTATGSLPLHFPWPKSNVECAQQRVPCWRILIRVGRVCLGTLGHPFSSDGCSLKATFPWKQTVALWYLKSLDSENQRKVKCLTQGHRAWVEKLPCLRKTHTHTHTPFSNISVLLADLQGGSNLIFRLHSRQGSRLSGQVGIISLGGNWKRNYH